MEKYLYEYYNYYVCKYINICILDKFFVGFFINKIG